MVENKKKEIFMKKFVAFLIAMIMAMGMFAFAACGNDSNKDADNGGNQNQQTEQESTVKGSIDGNYTKIDRETEGGAAQYELITEKLGEVHPAIEEDGTAGGNAAATAAIEVKIGDKALTLSLDAALALIMNVMEFDEKGPAAIAGMAFTSELGVKADEGFGEALTALAQSIIDADLEGEEDDNAGENQEILGIMALLDNFDINAELNAYVKDETVEEEVVKTIYADAKVTGIPDAIKALVPEDVEIPFDELAAGMKYFISVDDLFAMVEDFIGGMFGGGKRAIADDGMAEPQAALFGIEDGDVSDDDYYYEDEESGISGKIEMIATMFMGFSDISADIAADGSMKLQISLKAETKDTLIAMLKGFIDDDTPEITAALINSVNISKLDLNVYLALDADGNITAVAGNVDVAVSATVGETPISVSVNGALDLSFAVPETIEYPSFAGYENLINLFMPAEEDQAAA